MTVPRQPGGTWDYRRNTSQVFQPGPDALPRALDALAYFRRNEPRHFAWIAKGYPNLTEQEHREWFSSDYAKAKSKRQT